ncbi:MAG: sulfate adenylyltransferase [Candidatus Omnitrophica bacterium]|nr:sulfate adenylyltransferase [Candidatus Omnitrophota bacterium]MCM8793248.1 sulfate adenylyltransferase [Candidatus Omnitrophota bacterium]
MLKEISPHGGRLVNRIVEGKEKKDLERKALGLKKILLNEREISDLEMIAIGAFSPLEGFLTEEDYKNVIENLRLKNGLVWSIPITLSATEEEIKDFKEKEDIALLKEREILGLLHLEQIYTYDKNKEAELVYKTTDLNHPGVNYLFKQGEYLLGGEVTLLNQPEHKEFKDYWLTPQQTRKIFQERGWKRVVGFQTRNPIHRAHEFIIKTALEICDGLFLNPLVGETRKEDIPAEVRMACYETLLEKYFPRERVIMAVYRAAMRYAGPREAILHALVRKNFGCTHFIVGRDHAGVGNYYGPFEAQEIFDNFLPEELDVTPLFFENAFFCRHCGGMATIKTCPHPETEHFALSGTKVRELLSIGEVPPPEFTRPEIANILIEWFRKNR